jgi:hypothetical protein
LFPPSEAVLYELDAALHRQILENHLHGSLPYALNALNTLFPCHRRIANVPGDHNGTLVRGNVEMQKINRGI